MKRLKKIENYWTLETSQRSTETELLCDSCGNKDCSLRLIISRVKINRFNAKVAVTRCESFIPVLTFRDAAGTEEEFNTFRLGAAWAKRVDKGDLVALHTTDGAHIAYAEVVDTHSGPFKAMSDQFGIDNHLSIQAEVAGEVFDLEKIMTACYGGHRFNNQSNVTVIELRRINGVSEERTAHLRCVH